MTPPACCWCSHAADTHAADNPHRTPTPVLVKQLQCCMVFGPMHPSAGMTLSNVAAANSPTASVTFDQHRCKHLLLPVLQCSGRHLLPAASRLLLGGLHPSSATQPSAPPLAATHPHLLGCAHQRPSACRRAYCAGVAVRPPKMELMRLPAVLCAGLASSFRSCSGSRAPS